MDIQIIAAIIIVVGTLFGVWLGSILSRKSSVTAIEASNKNALDLMKRQEFHKGASIFRAAFVNEIFALRKNIKSGDAMVSAIITDNVLIIHEKAKIMFEPFLTASELSSFNDTWEKYKNYDYTDIPFSNNITQINKDMSNFCLEQINNLLLYAKPKT